MKTLLKILIIAALVVLFGSVVFTVLATALRWLATVLEWLAKILDFFGWGGVL